MRQVRVARVYESLRTAHLERFAVMAPATVLYHGTRYDYDLSVLPDGVPVPRQVSRPAAVRELLTGGYDVVELNEPLMTRRWPDLLAQLVAARLAPRRRALAVAYCIGLTDPADELAARLPRPLARLATRVVLGVLVRGFDRLAFGTQGCYDLVAGYVPHRVLARRAAVFPALPTACDCPPGEREPGTVLFVGAFSERKGVRQLLAGWEALGAGAQGLRLHLIGKGPLLEHVQHWAAGRDEVRVDVDPPRSLVHEALRRAHVLVLLSQRVGAWREQVGLPLVEGLGHGCEVVTTSETGLAGWLQAHGHEVLAPTAPASQVAQALARAAGSPRDAGQVLADLPTTDSRIAADRWLLRPPTGRGQETAMTGTSDVRATVLFAPGKGPQAWARRHAQSPVPGRWPYGLDGLEQGGAQVSAVELRPPSAAARLARRASAGRVSALRPATRVAGDLLCWDEQTAAQIHGTVRGERLLSGVIWVTDRLDRPEAAADVARTRDLLRGLDGLWTLSRPQVDVLAQWLGPDAPPVSFLRFGVDPDFYGFAPYQQAEPMVVSIGGDRDRDPRTLFAALEIVRSERPDVRVVVQSSSKEPAPEGIEVLAHVPHAQVAELYARASVVAVATRPNQHVSGMTVALEAMSTGRPVVISDTPGMDDYVDETTGRVVPVADPAAMAAQILALLADRGTAGTLGAAGRAAVEDRFTSTAMCRDLLGILAR
ncbi:glycosyltransferase [Angustibacter luteus]|uniref:Glycosyltransferase n=1 Tax=Angustibacter luteus TaxID=658456 RepID=A0ABW1JB52_9ACTN